MLIRYIIIIITITIIFYFLISLVINNISQHSFSWSTKAFLFLYAPFYCRFQERSFFLIMCPVHALFLFVIMYIRYCFSSTFCNTSSFLILSLQLVIEPILVLNLVRARSSWLGLGTEPPADRSPNCRRIVWMRRSTHTWPIKLCREAWRGRSLIDRRTHAVRRRRRTPSQGLLMVMLIEIASVLCHSVSQEAVDTR